MHWQDSQLLDKCTAADLVDIFTSPTPESPLASITKICHSFLYSSNQELSSSRSVVLRQKIKIRGSSKYIPAADLVTDGASSGKSFNSVAEHTLESYARTLSLLVLFLIRRNPAAEYPQRLAHAISNLEVSLDSDEVDAEEKQGGLLLKVLECVLFEDIGLEGLKGRAHVVEEFLIARSLDRNGRWKESKDVKQLISPILFSSRCAVLNLTTAAVLDINLSKEQKEGLSEQYLNAVSFHVTSSAYSFLKMTKGLCDTFSSTDKKPNMRWMGDQLIIDGKMPITLDLFRIGIRRAISRLQEIQLQWMHGLPISTKGLSSKEIYDEATQHGIGYGFVTDPRNAAFRVNQGAVLDQIEATPILKARFLDKNGKWKGSGVQLLADLGNEYISVLDLVMTCTAGPPSRRTDVACHRLLNSKDSLRTLYIFENHLGAALGNRKRQAHTGKPESVSYFIPEEIAALLYFYLAYMRTLHLMMGSMLSGHVGHSSDLGLLFTRSGVPLDGPALGKSFASRFRRFVGVDFGVRAYRDMAKAFWDRFLEHIPFEKVIVKTYAIHRQFGHSETMGATNYGRTDSCPVRKDAFEGSAAWAVLSLGPADDVKLVLNELPRGVEGTQAADFDSRSMSTKAEALSSEEIPMWDSEHQYAYSVIFQSPNAQLPPMIRDALRVIRSRKDDVLFVGPTGCGKSMLHLIPHLLGAPGQVTTLVLPTTPLIADVLRQLKLLHVETRLFSEVRDASCVKSSCMLICSLEDFTNPLLPALLARLNSQGRLLRVVFDEAHCLKDWESFRAGIDAIPRVRSALSPAIQAIFLTATALPNLVEKIKSAWVGKDGTLIEIRHPATFRKNIALDFCECATSGDVISKAVSVISAYSGPDLCMVVCRSLNQVD
ncbi:hypothetical protein HDU98_004081 [Podochytrium sp. JEL0797]|nr:hypothetical protein HDU98_004081 [Podochytrium sp. JEL0797]